MENFNTKKVFLYLLVCSIVLSALMGIWAIISDQFGDLEGKVLSTTLTVVGTSVLGLSCGAFLESPRNLKLKFVPITGIGFVVLSALVFLWLIWEPFDSGEKNLYKLLFVSLTFAFSLALLSLLSLAQLAKRFSWALIAVYAVMLPLNLIGSTIVVFELSTDGNFVTRLIGVLSVVAASLTVMIPIFHRLSRSEFFEFETPTVENIDAEIDKLKAQISRLEKQKEQVLSVENNI